ncbi:MAG: FtsX-like permease family protein [Clostridiales bacterium]|nr:FtsX-like permease family protein [Clostridiales bacterium]
MSKPYIKDIIRTIRNEWKRFLSILLITALGVGMMTGLYAATLDMYYSADIYFDQQSLFDIRILSTMGLTQKDVDELALIDGVDAVEGGYIETIYTYVTGVRMSADMSILSRDDINMPYLRSGTLPTKSGEIAVTQKYIDESGKVIGDTIHIEEEYEDDSKESITGDVNDINLVEKQPKKDSSTEENDLDVDVDVEIDLEIDIEEEAETPSFLNSRYIITGVVLDPMNIQSDGQGSSFRTTNTSDYSFFITESDLVQDIFTVVYISLAGTKNINAFSDEYENKVQAVVDNIESQIKQQREQARDNSILLEAGEKIQDVEDTMNESFADADMKFSDAWEDIEEARIELADGEATLIIEEEDAKKKIAEARSEIRKAKKELADAEKQLAEGEAQLADGEAEVNENAQKLEEGKEKLMQERQEAEVQLAAAELQLNEAQRNLDANRAQIEAGVEQLKGGFGEAWPEDEWIALVNANSALAAIGADDNAIVEGTASEVAALLAKLQIPMSPLAESIIQTGLGMGKLNAGQQILDGQKAIFTEEKASAMLQISKAEAELAEGESQLEIARKTLQEKKLELEDAKSKLADGKAELTKGEKKLNKEEADAKVKIAEAWEEINEGKEELAKGEAELVEQEKEYADKKEEAKQKIADAYEELDDIDKTHWYVQDRTSLDSYSSLKSDLSSIEAIGAIFPVMFLLVAVLMSLTTMTRMVEEERGLIGTYKAIGYGNATIYVKYLIFAFIACLVGGVTGDLIGFIFLPKFIMYILEILYNLPEYYLRFDALYGVGGVLLFMVAIVGATALACRKELKQMPAKLLRPKAPRAGSRVLLERVTIIWNRIPFLNKVTIRNLFRYKKRLFMTIGGIMACTALIVCGFAIRDSVDNLAPRQYEYIYQYDLMAVFSDEDNDDMIKKLSDDENIEDYMNLRIESVKLINADEKSETVQLLVIPRGDTLEDYVRLINLKGREITLNDDGVIITQNAARMLNLKAKDIISLQNMDLMRNEATISEIVQNNLGNNIYITQDLYESLFGTYAPNAVLAHMSDGTTDHASYAEELLDNDSVLSAISTFALQDDFGFDLIYAVVLLLIVMAGGLAFVVLFTLSNTNISERVRELATIKVLGFYDNEVYQYVNKETLILTVIGIILGLPLGYLLSDLLFIALNMPSIHFTLYIKPVTYLIAVAITLSFALIVNWITNRSLDRIDMVEALKSVE